MLVDALDRIRGRADPEPPSRDVCDFVGGGDFRGVGEEFASYARELAGLTSSDPVLDVGSGVGRIVLPLTRIINGQGSYDGLEIVPRGVRGVSRTSPQSIRTSDHHADIANST